MIVYLDVNIVLDFLLGNREHSLEVAQVISLLNGPEHTMFMSPNTIIMGFFHIRKQRDELSELDIKHTLALFRKRVDCVPVEGDDIDNALSMKIPGDVEDGFQIILAEKCKADILLSNDRKGFRSAPMKVLTSKGFLQEWEL